MVTPAPVPSDNPMSARGFPPGVTEQGVVDPIALGRAHEAVLNETSYTYFRKRIVKYTNGTLLTWWTTTRQVVALTERYYGTTDRYSSNTSITNHTVRNKSIWSDGTRRLVAISGSQTNETKYQYHELPDRSRGSYFKNAIRNVQFHNLFYAIDTEIANHTTHNGTTLYRITSTEITDPSVLRGIGTWYKDPRNLTFYAVIDSRGLVHEYQFSYTATLSTTNRSVPVHIVKTVRYSEIGNTTVERPSWYSKANRTTPISLGTASR